MKNIKQINGVPCVLGKVHMLSTESLGVIMSDVGPYDTDMVLISELPENLRGHERPHNHLYITTDEEIKEGDWFIWLKYNLVERATKKDNNKECRKIIASTDPKIYITIGEHYNAYNKELPQIPQQFIQDYCNKIVDEVWIEVELPQSIKNKLISGDLQKASDSDRVIKLNSNNEIMIHNVEEKMYSEKDLPIQAMKDALQYCEDESIENTAFVIGFYTDIKKWIEENL